MAPSPVIYIEMQEKSFRNDILPLKDKLFRLALRITLDRAEAEDVVQDTMIRVWSKRDEWEKLDSIEAFCFTIARNLAIDRSQKMDANHAQITPEMENKEDASQPFDQMAKDEQMQIIHHLVNSLPEKQRTILQLRDIEEKNYKEIAEIVHESEDYVKVNLFRARQKVKQGYLKINEYGL